MSKRPGTTTRSTQTHKSSSSHSKPSSSQHSVSTTTATSTPITSPTTSGQKSQQQSQSNQIVSKQTPTTTTLHSSVASTVNTKPNSLPSTLNQPHQTDLPYGAFGTWEEYQKQMLLLADIELGLQTQLSPQNSFTVDWSVSEHTLTEQMNLIATIIVPYNTSFFDPEKLPLGSRIQFLHPDSPKFSLSNIIPVTGFIDDIVMDDDTQQYSIDVIIDTISTLFLRNPTMKLPTLELISATPSSTSPLASPLHATLAQNPLSPKTFLNVFAGISFPPKGYQIIIHNPARLS